MTLFEDLQKQNYLDKIYGTVSNRPNEGPGFNCDNPSLFTAEGILLNARDPFPVNYNRFFQDAEVEVGLFHRFPGDKGDISIDELVGAATISTVSAMKIVEYGRKHWWVFQPEGGKFRWGAWMWRYQLTLPYLRYRASMHMSVPGRLLWSLGCCLSPLTAYMNTSGKLLMWVQIERLWGQYYITDLAITFWNWRMRLKYPGGPKELFRIYFGPGHPFVNWAPERF